MGSLTRAVPVVAAVLAFASACSSTGSDDNALDGTWESTADERFCVVGSAIDTGEVTTSTAAPGDDSMLQGWKDLATLTIEGDHFDGDRPCGEVAGASECEGSIEVADDELHVTSLECDGAPVKGDALPDAEVTVDEDTLIVTTKGGTLEYERG